MDTPWTKPAAFPLAILGGLKPRLALGLLLGSLAMGSTLNTFGAEPGVILILRAAFAPNAAVRQAQAEVKSDPTGFMVRAGGVVLETDLLNQHQRAAQQISPNTALQSPAARRLALEFFPDAYVEVEITSEAQPDPTTLMLQGRIPQVELATFTLTYTPESYFITFSDPNSPALYRVVGDSQTGEGRVIEYDMSKRPPVYEAPPLIPPVR